MWIGTRNPARASAVSGLQLCFKKTACLGAGRANRELPQVPRVQRGSPGTLGGAWMAAVGTRCPLPGCPWGDARALPPSGWEGTAWLCSCWQAPWPCSGVTRLLALLHEPGCAWDCSSLGAGRRPGS